MFDNRQQSLLKLSRHFSSLDAQQRLFRVQVCLVLERFCGREKKQTKTTNRSSQCRNIKIGIDCEQGPFD